MTKLKADASSLGHAIKMLRNKEGLSLVELGKKSGVTPGMISLLENGKRNPSLDTLKSILTALGWELWLYKPGEDE